MSQFANPLNLASDNRAGRNAFRIYVSAGVVLLGFVGFLLHWTNRPVLERLCEESGLVESFTALLYFLAAGAFVYANWKRRFRNVWLWGYALLFFMIAGEEISWGQSVLGFAAPQALAEINVQGETNLHNIEGIHGMIRALGLVIVLGICYAVPLSDRFLPPFLKLYVRLRHPVFPLWATGIVTVAILMMVLPRLCMGTEVFELDELGEFFLAVAFLIFADSVLHARRTRVPAELPVEALEEIDGSEPSMSAYSQPQDSQSGGVESEALGAGVE